MSWKEESQRHAMSSKGIKTGNLRGKTVIKSKYNSVKTLPKPTDVWSHNDVLLLIKRINMGLLKDDSIIEYAWENGIELDKNNEDVAQRWLLAKKSKLTQDELDIVKNMKKAELVGFAEAIDITGDASYKDSKIKFPIYRVSNESDNFDYSVFNGELYMM
jgi:hypothetical protein